MTAIEFLRHIGDEAGAECLRLGCATGEEGNHWWREYTKRNYDAYKRAYNEVSLEKLLDMARDMRTMRCAYLAARDRDAGRPVVVVPELEQPNA